MDFGRCVGFIGGFAIWDSSYAYTMMGLEKSDKQPMGKRNVEIYFEIENLNSLFDKIKKENIDFVHEIKEQPWVKDVLGYMTLTTILSNLVNQCQL